MALADQVDQQQEVWGPKQRATSGHNNEGVGALYVRPAGWK